MDANAEDKGTSRNQYSYQKKKKKKKIDWLRFERDYVCIKDRRKGNLIRIHILRKLLKTAARN